MRFNILSELCRVTFGVQSQCPLRYVASQQYSTATVKREVRPFKSIPGLSSLPYFGPLHHFLPVIGRFGPKANIFDVADSLYKEYGPVVKINGIFGRPDMVMLFDPEHIHQESNPLRPGFETSIYYREVLRKDVFEDFEGIHGLMAAQGKQWRDFRTKVNPALMKLKLISVYADALDNIAQDFIKRLKLLNNNRPYLEDQFLQEVNKWSLESVAFVGLGARLGCFEDELTPEHPASKLMKCAEDVLQSSFELEFMPNPWKYVSTPGFKRLMKTYDTQWEISAMYIDQARKRINKRNYDIPEEDKSIIEKLLAIDEKVAIMMANEMMLAGIDTVAFTATGLLYQLASNPDKQEKLRQEIRSSKPQKRYLRACLKETQRFWHVVPSNLRRTDKDHIVGGYHIPPGIDVIAPNQFLSSLERYYPRSKEFIPERWLADKNDLMYYGNAHPMVTLPFGFGIRSCIGRRIAELEIETLMKNLIDEYKVTWEGPPIKVATKLMNTFVKPFCFRFEAAK